MAFILAIDASLSGCAVCLYDSDADCVIAEKFSTNDMKQAEELAPMVEEVWGKRELHSIAVTIGPGSFTGIRIALAFAKAFAFSQSLPLYGVSNFDVAALVHGDDQLCLIDTKRGDFYAGGAGREPFILAADLITPDMITIHKLEPQYIAKASLTHGSIQAEPLYIREAEVSLSKTIPPRIIG